jgi:hypothetical protein
VTTIDDHLDAYMDMGADDIGRLVLCLLIEETLRQRISALRQDLPTEPIEGFKEFGFVRGDIVSVSHPLR